MFGAFSFKIDFSKPVVGFGLFGVYQSHIALWEIRFRTVTGVQTVVRPIRASPKDGCAKKVGSKLTLWLVDPLYCL